MRTVKIRTPQNAKEAAARAAFEQARAVAESSEQGAVAAAVARVKTKSPRKPKAPPVTAAPKPTAANLANPGQRSKLPDAALSPAQLAERQRIAQAQRVDATFSTPQAGRSARRYVNSLVDLETRPQLNEIDKRAALIEPQRAANNDRAQALVQAGARNAQAAAARPGASQASTDYAAALAQAYALQGVEADQRYTTAAKKDTDDLSAQRTELVGQRGSLRSKYLGEQQQKDFENSLAGQTLLGKTEYQAQQASIAAANAKTARLTARSSAAARDRSGDQRDTSLTISQQNADTAAQRAADAAAKASDSETGTKWLGQSAQNKAKDDIAAAAALAKKLRAETPGISRAELARKLVEGSQGADTVNLQTGQIEKTSGTPKLPEDYASIALDLTYDGAISRRNVGVLHARKVKVRDLGFKTSNGVPKAKKLPKKVVVKRTGGA